MEIDHENISSNDLNIEQRYQKKVLRTAQIDKIVESFECFDVVWR